MSPHAVRGLIARVFQDVSLFDDTIANNIGIGNPAASEEEIWEFAEKARVTSFPGEREQGMDTRLGLIMFELFQIVFF